MGFEALRRFLRNIPRRRGRLVCALALGAAVLVTPSSALAPQSALAAAPTFAGGELIVVGRGAYWFRADGSRVRQLFGRAEPLAVAIAPDNTPFVGNAAGLIETYNSDGNFTSAFGLFPDPYVITALARAPDGIVYVAVSQGRATDIYPFRPFGSSRNQFSVRGQVVDLDVAADSCTLYYALSSGQVKRVNGCAAGREVPQFATNARAVGVRLLPDGTLLVSGLDRVIRRIRPDGGVAGRYAAPAGTGGWASAIDLTPDGSAFWSATRSGRVYQVSLASGRVLRGPVVGDSGAVRDLAVLGAPRGLAPTVGEKPGAESLDVDGVFPLSEEVSSMIQSGPPEPTNACASDVPGSLVYSASGRAVGPYDGSFEADGQVSFGPQNLTRAVGPLGLAPGRITALRAGFSIRSPQGAVRGTLSSPPAGNRAANVAICARFVNRTFPRSTAFPTPLTGYFWAISAPALRYEATIEVNGRTYRDRGTSYVYRDEYHLTHADGALGGLARRYTQSWVSESFSLTDSFNARDQVEAHSAGLTRSTKVVELVIRWSDPRDSFDVKGIRLVDSGSRALHNASKLKPRGVQVQIQRSRRSLKVRITKLKPRRLAFQITPRRLSGSTRVTTEVRRRS